MFEKSHGAIRLSIRRFALRELRLMTARKLELAEGRQQSESLCKTDLKRELGDALQQSEAFRLIVSTLRLIVSTLRKERR